MSANLPVTLTHSSLRKQQGAVLMVMLVIIIIGSAAFLVTSLNNSSQQIQRDKITADALAQAKEALISYAASVQISYSTASNQPRPGDLPCPDTNDDGIAEPSCGDAAGSSQTSRLGRLPWKTLGIPELRDSTGEHLWYAVSNNFKNNTRTATLNSDTPGTITVRSIEGNILYNGCTSFGASCPLPGALDAPYGTGAVAIIIAPGSVMPRQDGTQQDRSAAGINNPVNYLDNVTGVEDNADFVDSTTNGFIQGPVKDVTGIVTIVNDQINVITQDNIMQAVQKRVASEVKNCLDLYAINNYGRYPWAVPLNYIDPVIMSPSAAYDDKSGTLFGRIPSNMGYTKSDSVYMSVFMNDSWEPVCMTHTGITASTWWKQWREMVFYGVAKTYKPVSPPTTSPDCTPPGECLTVNPPSSVANNKYVVIVAGRIIGTQARTTAADKSTLNNYLEAPNNGGGISFSQNTPSSTFNDTVVYKQ
jgi:type II secretory pathway pseudopilin PulG